MGAIQPPLDPPSTTGGVIASLVFTTGVRRSFHRDNVVKLPAQGRWKAWRSVTRVMYNYAQEFRRNIVAGCRNYNLGAFLMFIACAYTFERNDREASVFLGYF